MWEPEMLVEKEMQVHLTSCCPLPACQGGNYLPAGQVLAAQVGSNAGLLPGFPGQKGMMWVIPLAAEEFS